MKSMDLHLRPIDLHVHSTCSDGTFSPRELVDYAIKKGLAAFALTDHDTVDGLEAAISYAENLRRREDVDTGQIPEVVPGIEFSTEYQGSDIHILGLCMDFRQPAFCQALRAFVDSREHRNHKMCRLLTQAGIPVSYEDLLSEYPDAVITRAHYAAYLLSHGYVGSRAEAFARYVGDHAPCFVPREKVTPAQAVELILQAGGIPVLAHPTLYHFSDARLEELIASLVPKGLMAIETIYSTYNAREERLMRQLASRYHLFASGGSDFHGANKPGLDMGCGYGRLFVSYAVLETLQAALPVVRACL